MRHRVKRHRISRPKDHRMALLRNQARELVEHGSIVTTVSKAKALKVFFDKLMSKAVKAAETDDKIKSVNLRRQINRYLNDRRLTNKFVDEIASRFSGRKGGYTRIIRIGYRRGDGAEMALIQLAESEKEE
jgi:large subunit ribosomal protein L17